MQNSFAKNLYDEAIYLKTLPSEIKKYVIINEGSPDECPDGLTISSHTIKFLAPQDTEFIYPGCQKFKRLLASDIQSPTVFLPQQQDENFLNKLGLSFPSGEIENNKNFSVFKINF